MTLKNIKLIIWDLDETFWNGTISEESVQLVPDHVEFIKNLSDMGIVNSICSKNDYDVAKNRLEKDELWNYFVFSSIDWTPKGQRVKYIIDTMKLRNVNVLFVDDNIQNLEEAKHFCPEIMTAFPQDISELIREAKTAAKTDQENKRLKQYKQLEKKEVARTDFTSNEEFLLSCNIKVDICYDCENQKERIHELIMRSNQLNYTKFRQGKEELYGLINSVDVKTGYVKVNDKFGDYGIVGFFALKDGNLIHFAFSCRTLGMRIEQYVYYMLGCPEINVIGDVASELNKTENPEWINQKHVKLSEPQKASTSMKILFKGPCDMSQMYAFLDLGNEAVTEFTYMNNAGISTEGHNHTSQIVTSLYASEERKKEILDETVFFDKDMLSTALRTEKFDFVVLSMLTDGNLGVYKRKETGEEVALCEKKYSLVDSDNREKYLNNKVFTSYIKFTNEMLDDFALKYEFADNSDANTTVSNLQKIWEYIDKDTKLILLLGSEREFKKKCKESYFNRHIEHAKMNAKISAWAENKANVILLPFDKYIKGDSDYLDTINHFVKRVYYDLAVDLSEIFTDGSKSIEVKGRTALVRATIKQRLRYFKSNIFKLLNH